MPAPTAAQRKRQDEEQEKKGNGGKPANFSAQSARFKVVGSVNLVPEPPVLRPGLLQPARQKANSVAFLRHLDEEQHCA
jgi:hypothetical protein